MDTTYECKRCGDTDTELQCDERYDACCKVCCDCGGHS